MIPESVFIYKHFFGDREGHDKGENTNSLLPYVKINKQNVLRSCNVKLALNIVQGNRPEELKFERGSGKVWTAQIGLGRSQLGNTIKMISCIKKDNQKRSV